MLYTRKGDDGTTKTFGCDQRISKSSIVAEALGALDEVNSFLGIARARTQSLNFKIKPACRPAGITVKNAKFFKFQITSAKSQTSSKLQILNEVQFCYWKLEF